MLSKIKLKLILHKKLHNIYCCIHDATRYASIKSNTFRKVLGACIETKHATFSSSLTMTFNVVCSSISISGNCGGGYFVKSKMKNMSPR